GTLGGPQSFKKNTGILQFGAAVNNNGAFTGFADTPTPDPLTALALCFNPDCFVSGAFQWQDGVITKLPGLRRGWSSAPVWISASGLIAGFSQNGQIDPLTGYPESRAVLWEHGGITDLETLPEGGYESL